MNASRSKATTSFPTAIACCLILLLSACSKKSAPVSVLPPPPLAEVSDSMPPSEIDIPVLIALKPLYAMAEKTVPLQYTSLGYPTEFVVEDCQTRYMYRFRRGPLQFKGDRNQLGMSFTGYYLIAGGQRLCNGSGSDRTALTPWSPTCTCGLNEGERRVNVAFSASLALTPDYRITPQITGLQPVPVDKCTVCFWGQDITKTVMQQVKAQLDEAGRATADTLRRISLRPQFQKVWDLLNQVQPLYGMGYLQLNPERIRLSQFTIRQDTLRLSMGLTAKPVITQTQPSAVRTVVPDISDRAERNGFRLYFDARLRYDSLSALANARLRDRRITIESVNRYVVIRDLSIYAAEGGRLGVRVSFSGSAEGTFYVTGIPTYEAEKKILYFKGLDYDIRSGNVTVNTAKWLFNKKILNELEANTRFDLAPYEQQLLDKVNAQLNREVRKGVQLNGRVNEVSIPYLRAQHDVLQVRCMSSGEMSLVVRELPL